jgi:glycosyltransferase involved in cell wall biosynthesis
MRVLLVHDYGTPMGGAEVMTQTVRDGLRRLGHDARVFASSARAPGENGGRSFADYECFGTTSRFRTLLQTANPSAALRLRRVLAEFRPDVVHVRIFLTQLSPLVLPLLRDVPSIYHAVWYRAVCPIGTKMLPSGAPCVRPAGAVCYASGCVPARDWAALMVQMRLWRWWRDAFDVVVVNSDAVGRRLAAEGIGPVEVISNGVPPARPRPPLAAPPTALFAGRLVAEKGVDVLLRAFARVAAAVADARLVVAGDGRDREALTSTASALGLDGRVTMLGHLPRAELERVAAGAWVQVIPSRWAEPFGIVAAEAMMRGTAAVASRVGGLADIVEDGRTGFLVPPGDVDALADALARLLGERALAEAMGRAGREAALARFGADAFVDRLVDLYGRVRRARSAGRGRDGR